MTFQAFTIPYSERESSPNGLVLVRYDANLFQGPPAVFATSTMGSANSAVVTPTVSRVTDSYVEIVDFQAGDGALNVLFTDKQKSQVHGLQVFAETYLISQPEVQYFTGVANNPVNILTPHIHDTASYAKGVDMVTGTGSPLNDPDLLRVSIFTKRFGSDKLLNALSVQSGIGEEIDGEMQIQAGVALKQRNRIEVPFPKKWKKPPAVFLTPLNKTGGTLPTWEAVEKVTNDSFTAISENSGAEYAINWVAVKQDAYPPLPKLEKNHLDEAFEHFFGHFPADREKVNRHRSTIENMILRGREPTAELVAEEFENRPSFPEHRQRNISERNLTIAAICVDSVSILTTVIGLGISGYLSNAKMKIAEVVADDMLESEEASLLKKSVSALNPKDAKLAWAAIGLSGQMMKAGVIKTILVGIAESLAWWQWLIIGVKLAAQIVALSGAALGTGGAAVAAIWIARVANIVAGLASVAQLGMDVTKLVDIDRGKPVSAPP